MCHGVAPFGTASIVTGTATAGVRLSAPVGVVGAPQPSTKRLLQRHQLHCGAGCARAAVVSSSSNDQRQLFGAASSSTSATSPVSACLGVTVAGSCHVQGHCTTLRGVRPLVIVAAERGLGTDEHARRSWAQRGYHVFDQAAPASRTRSQSISSMRVARPPARMPAVPRSRGYEGGYGFMAPLFSREREARFYGIAAWIGSLGRAPSRSRMRKSPEIHQTCAGTKPLKSTRAINPGQAARDCQG